MLSGYGLGRLNGAGHTGKNSHKFQKQQKTCNQANCAYYREAAHKPLSDKSNNCQPKGHNRPIAHKHHAFNKANVGVGFRRGCCQRFYQLCIDTMISHKGLQFSQSFRRGARLASGINGLKKANSQVLVLERGPLYE